MPDVQIKICTRCQTQFECKVENIQNCQCTTVSLNQLETQYIAQKYSNCLCINCLKELKMIASEKNFFVSNDKELLNLDFIHQYLSQESYWAKGRSLESIKNSIKNSLCFGVYSSENQQVGFARVVTDYAIFAWLMDVFILKDYQGKGLGKQLVESIMNYSELQTIQRWGLNTWDAHELYKKYGFTEIEKPEIFMEKLRKN